METLSYCQLMQRCIELTEQRDVLVVENAGLKSALTAILQPGEATLSREHRATAVAAIETPATSSAIAALRAEGVEMFATHAMTRHGELLTAPNDYATNQAITATRRAGEFALQFARQLRESKGANHE